MKTINELLNYQPQMAHPSQGKEPPLREMLYNYYSSYGLTYKQASKAVDEYVQCLIDFEGEAK